MYVNGNAFFDACQTAWYIALLLRTMCMYVCEWPYLLFDVCKGVTLSYLLPSANLTRCSMVVSIAANLSNYVFSRFGTVHCL